MKALVKNKAEQGLWMQDVPVPRIGRNDVLIKIAKTAICGTDIHIFNWDAWAQKTIKTPLVIGVTEIGTNVHDVEIGELVSGEGHIVCGHCRNCLAGRRHLCTAPNCIGVDRDGAFVRPLQELPGRAQASLYRPQLYRRRPRRRFCRISLSPCHEHLALRSEHLD